MATNLQGYIEQAQSVHQDIETVNAACALMLSDQLAALAALLGRIADAVEKPPGQPGVQAAPVKPKAHHEAAHHATEP
jgi:hypothetical protein